jgi:inward rectifier potassium channel
MIENVNQDTGFGERSADMGGRMVNKDGSFNIRRIGIHVHNRVSNYQNMLTMKRWQFLIVILLVYLLINSLFTALYWLSGPEGLQGVDYQQDTWGQLKQLFFFSTQTLTTVGYGRINPVSELANWIAAFESLVGFLSLAIATGLLYGRFSRPRAFIRFSNLIVHTNYKGVKALMFRLVCYKDDHLLMNAEIKVNVRIMTPDNTYRFYNLNLERSRVDSLVLNWTVVHPIDEDSPFYGLSQKEIVTLQPEIAANLTGFDEVYSSMVVARNSYAIQDFKFGFKFLPMYFSKSKRTELDLSKLNLIDQE